MRAADRPSQPERSRTPWVNGLPDERHDRATVHPCIAQPNGPMRHQNLKGSAIDYTMTDAPARSLIARTAARQWLAAVLYS